MSDYGLSDLGDGRFALTGRMTFDTAANILRESEHLFEQHTLLTVDLSGVTQTDSAGLALLLEWITWANHTVREIRFEGMPAKIDAIARTLLKNAHESFFSLDGFCLAMVNGDNLTSQLHLYIARVQLSLLKPLLQFGDL